MRIPVHKIFITIFLLLGGMVGWTQKNDKVFLKNGDVITGEIKSMKLAKLNFDMNGPGIIYVKWEEIVRLRSERIFEISLQNGEVLLSKLDSVLFEVQHIAIDDIVEIVPIRNRILKRLSGDVNLGFNYAKSNSIVQFNFGSSVTYRVPKFESNFKLSTVISQSTSDTSKKQDVTLGVLRQLDNRYYLMSYLGWETNTELGLENRFLLAAGGGKIIFNDNSQRLLTGGGLSYNIEQFSSSTTYKGNLEGLAMVEFKKFRYSFPKINIDAQYKFYPGISDWGRIRMNLSINTSIEILKDFLAGLTFYNNYDNRPSSDAASKNDYGINFTLGYSFGK
jgi:hypothetical protein